MKTQPLKGMRDLLPREQALRDYIQGQGRWPPTVPQASSASPPPFWRTWRTWTRATAVIT